MTFHACELLLANPWKIAGKQGSSMHPTVIVELQNHAGVCAWGEAAPSVLYGESVAGVLKFLTHISPAQLSFEDIAGSMNYLESLPEIPLAAKCALNVALLDGAAKLAGKPLFDFLGLGFREQKHVTSFSIGLATPEIIRQKVAAAAEFPVLKLKVGEVHDAENVAALRSVAPEKLLCVDANEAWKTKETALQKLEWLAATDKKIQFVEQPLPRNASLADLKWLKARSPLPIFADEACHNVKDISFCAEGFHGVNVKLVKTGGVSLALETLRAARQAGLQTMIGCMIESSVLISAAAHLAELTDYLDVDGNLLITNDPFSGVTAKNGVLSFKKTKEKSGLRVCKQTGKSKT